MKNPSATHGYDKCVNRANYLISECRKVVREYQREKIDYMSDWKFGQSLVFLKNHPSLSSHSTSTLANYLTAKLTLLKTHKYIQYVHVGDSYGINKIDKYAMAGCIVGWQA